jgi:hypothetical protein
MGRLPRGALRRLYGVDVAGFEAEFLAYWKKR